MAPIWRDTIYVFVSWCIFICTMWFPHTFAEFLRRDEKTIYKATATTTTKSAEYNELIQYVSNCCARGEREREREWECNEETIHERNDYFFFFFFKKKGSTPKRLNEQQTWFFFKKKAISKLVTTHARPHRFATLMN